MNEKLEELRYDAEITRQVCLEAMDRRYLCAAEMANIYFTALHDYRMELRRVRKAGESKDLFSWIW